MVRKIGSAPDSQYDSLLGCTANRPVGVLCHDRNSSGRCCSDAVGAIVVFRASLLT